MRGTCSSLTTAAAASGGAYSSVDELVLPVGPDGRYEHKVGTAFGPDKPVWSYTAPKRSEFYAEFHFRSQPAPQWKYA